MEDNKDASNMDESSEQTELQQNPLQPQESSQQNPLQPQESSQYQEVERDRQQDQSPPKETIMSTATSVLEQLLRTPPKKAYEQPIIQQHDQPSTSKDSSILQSCLQKGSPSQSLQREKRRSERIAEQQSQSKQLKLPDEKTEAENMEGNGENDKEGEDKKKKESDDNDSI